MFDLFKRMSQFVAPTGYVDIDNDCEFSIDLKSTRSRESVNPKDDLAFYFNTYIIPKYGLNNINVSNVASFMKELEMNWTKLSPDARNQVMDIMVDGILNKDSDFKTSLIQKMGIQQNIQQNPIQVSAPTQSSTGKSNFGKSTFGKLSSNKKIIITILIVVVIGYYLYKKKKVSTYGRLS